MSKQRTQQEVDALNRMLDLLEEHSVTYLATREGHFRSAIRDIYATVEKHLEQFEQG